MALAACSLARVSEGASQAEPATTRGWVATCQLAAASNWDEHITGCHMPGQACTLADWWARHRRTCKLLELAAAHKEAPGKDRQILILKLTWHACHQTVMANLRTTET